MTRQEVKEIVFKAIQVVQTNCGCELLQLDEVSIPRNSQPGFDSLREVETTAIICRLLSADFKILLKLSNNIFYSNKNEALKLKDTIDYIFTKINGISNERK